MDRQYNFQMYMLPEPVDKGPLTAVLLHPITKQYLDPLLRKADSGILTLNDLEAAVDGMLRINADPTALVQEIQRRLWPENRSLFDLPTK